MGTRAVESKRRGKSPPRSSPQSGLALPSLTGTPRNAPFSMFSLCLESHLSAQEDDALDTKEKRRVKVKDLIQNGVMNGYLVYSDNNIVGWSNILPLILFKVV